MLKRPITYVTFDNEPVTEDYYFNITRAEVAKMELGRSHLSSDGTVTGGMDSFLQETIATGDGGKIMAAFETFIDASYGVKSPDGKKHLKNDALLADFKSSAAYDQLFYELCTDAKAGAEFFNGIMPVDLKEEVEKARPIDNVRVLSAEDFQNQANVSEPTEEEMLAAFGDDDIEPEVKEKDYSKLTKAEFRALPKDEKILAFKQKSQQK